LSLPTGIVVARWPLVAALQRGGQGRDALLQRGKRIGVAIAARQLVDLGRQGVDVIAEPRQCVVGGDVGDDGTKRCNRAFELMNRGGVVIGPQDLVELGAKIADRLVVAGELFGRGQ